VPKFVKATPETKDLFASLIEGLACEPRSMFGYPCAFLNGQMFTGVFGNSIVVRLAEEQRAALMKEPGTQPFMPMPGRAMKEYVQFASLEDEELLGAWVKKAFAYAKTLPPKAAKAKAKVKKKPAAPTRKS
jgi:TfoX/Sxy family transcriptional regulator of competence genes